MATTSETLEQKIESAVTELVREHLVRCEAAAAAAVREGFRQATGPAPKARPGNGVGPTRDTPGRRRSREEVSALENRLYEAVCAHPGETMTILAETVGATPRELNRPALVLRRTGRVRSVGQRQSTRYFPLGR